MVHIEQTPPALSGPWLGSSLAEISTVEGWIGAAKLRPLVQRTPRCRLPMGMTVSPGWPEVWVVRLPSAEAVRRTALAREGRATETHWARLSGGLPARSRAFLSLPCPVYAPFYHTSLTSLCAVPLSFPPTSGPPILLVSLAPSIART